MTELSLSVSRVIATPIERVYQAWLDPLMLAKFMIPGSGMTVPQVDVDAREGGRFDIIMAAGDDKIPHGGVYLELKPFSRIVFSWESPMAIDGSIVSLDFTESESGTVVKLRHVKFSNEQARDSHENGWSLILSHLDEVLFDEVL